MRNITLPKNFVDLRSVPLDIHDIEMDVRQFYITLDFEMDNDVKSQCLDARGYLDSARILVRNLISIEENSYIKDYKKAYFFMQSNLGRVDSKITEVVIPQDSSRDTLIDLTIKNFENDYTTKESIIWKDMEVSIVPMLRMFGNSTISSDELSAIYEKDIVSYDLKNPDSEFPTFGDGVPDKLNSNLEFVLIRFYLIRKPEPLCFWFLSNKQIIFEC